MRTRSVYWLLHELHKRFDRTASYESVYRYAEGYRFSRLNTSWAINTWAKLVAAEA